MKIKNKREIEIPDGFICAGKRDCPALCKDLTIGKNMAMCCNFNKFVFWPDNSNYYVKAQDCIDATLYYLNGRKEG